MKKILSSLLALSVLFGSAAYLGNPETADMNFGTQAYAADIVKSGECGENLTWTLDSNGLLSIKGTGEMTDWRYYSLGHNQTSLGEVKFQGEAVPWFENREQIKSIDIGEGVESIGALAFIGVENAKNVNIPNSVTKIEQFAFLCCSSLKNVKIPYGIEAISKSTFTCCNLLESVSIPPTVKYIEDGAFELCFNLTKINIPESVEVINFSAFRNCARLTSVKIPSSVKEIGNYAFADCYNLESIIIMNPECEIYDSIKTLSRDIDKCNVYGYENSTSQAYAEKYGYKFVAVMLGDVDFDGAVNSSDASLILAEYAASATGGELVLNDSSHIVADVNGDNTVDSSDASTVLAYYAYTATGGELSLADFIEK